MNYKKNLKCLYIFSAFRPGVVGVLWSASKNHLVCNLTQWGQGTAQRHNHLFILDFPTIEIDWKDYKAMDIRFVFK